VIGRYRGKDLRALFAAQARLRRAEAVHFHVDASPELGREVAWHYGAAAAAFSYDDFFHEHVLTQGTAYTYVNGFNSAARVGLGRVVASHRRASSSHRIR
jgi:hypothetical protein